MAKEVYVRLMRMIDEREPAALVTVAESKGSAPGRTGFKMLVDRKGNTWGTVGGGLLEATVTRDAVDALVQKTSQIKTYTLTTDKAKGLGMLCGGEITVFIDAIIPGETLVIVGAGHVAQPLAAMAAMLHFNLVIIDDREEFCNKERFPAAEHCLVGDIATELGQLNLDDNCYVVIITRGHVSDETALLHCVNTDAAYIGMIGSKSKIGQVFQNLRDKGIEDKNLQKVYTPIGLDIGAQTAEEIAVSILAEIVAVKNGKARVK